MQRQRPRFGPWAVAALALGLALRLWFVAHAPAVAGDALVYGGIAKNLLLHGVYGFNQDLSPSGFRILPTLIRLPGYPLFLAACFRVFGMEHYRAAVYLQVLVDLWTCLLAAGLARRVVRNRAWLPVLWAAALCPFTANYVAVPLTETLVLWTIALAFYGVRRWQQSGADLNRWLWLVGLALAYSLLLRPDQGLLSAAVVPAVLWIAWREHRPLGLLRAAVPATVVVLCVFLPLVPWTLRNWHTFGLFQPLAPRSAADPGERSPVGFNLWYRTWGVDFVSTDEVYWNVNGARIEVADLPDRAFSLTCRAGHLAAKAQPLYSETAALLADYNATLIDSPELDARFAALAHRKLVAAPVCSHLLLPLTRFSDMLLRPRLELTRLPDRWWEPPVVGFKLAGVTLYAALDVIYILLAAWGLTRALRLQRGPARSVLWATVGMVVLRAALLCTLDNSEPRYTLEFFPVFFVWIGMLLQRPAECVKASAAAD
jgi:hypothetical protein